jgi:hypothetical protein
VLRIRRSDARSCSAVASELCISDWTAWYGSTDMAAKCNRAISYYPAL